MTDVWDRVGALIDAKIENKGLRVRVETDLGVKSVVYDANSVSAGKSFLMPDYQIIVEDDQGERITSYGEPVKFNFLKGAVIYGSLAFATIIAIKGIKGFIK